MGCIYKAFEVFTLSILGRWGKKVSRGRALDIIFTSEDETLDMIEKILLFYKENGKKGERFAETIERIRFENVERQLLPSC